MISQRQEDNLALYRKYRPKSFNEVTGQDVVVNALKSAVEAGNPAHAYVFSGARGVGKTTLARLFAKALGVSDKDIYELDAASNNSVEDIRDLRDSVVALPFESKYKVYILDEAHMLSKSAFNALLKTLEEPPSYCIFILATTEPEKLPDTIRSRAQVHTFKSPSKTEIALLVKNVAEKEGYKLGEGADDLIATLADGSFRDGLTHLQKVISVATDKTILTDDVERITGAPRGELLNDILHGISRGDIQSALKAVNSLYADGSNIALSLELLLERARAVLLLRHGGEQEENVLSDQFGKDDFTELKVLARDHTSRLKSDTLYALLEAQEKIRSASIKTLPLELAIIRTIEE